MPLFFFISGLFYRDYGNETILHIMRKLLTRLIFPALVAFIVYNSLVLGIFHRIGLPFSAPIPSLSGTVATFLFGGYLAAAYWFIGAYFLTYLYFHIVHRWLHKILSRVISPTATRSVFAVLYLGGAIISVYVATLLYGDIQDQDRHIIVSENQTEIVILRFIFGSGFYYLGSLFSQYKDRLPSSPAFPIGLAVVCFILEGFLFYRYNVFFSMQIMSFPNFYSPMITSLVGIVVFYAMSVAVDNSVAGKILSYIGRNSYSILLNHMFGFFILNIIFAAMGRISISDISNPYYRFQEYETYPLYILFGLATSITIPMLLKEGLQALKLSFSKIA